MLLSPEERLAYLSFQRVPPSAQFAPYIESYWYLRRTSAESSATQEFMHPGGGFGLVFNLGGGLSLDGAPLADPVFLDGTNTRSRQMGFSATVEAFGIRFRPGGAYPLLALPLAELANHTGLLDALTPRPVLRLHEQIGTAPTIPAKIAYLEAWLSARLQPTASPLVLHSLNLIRQQQRQIEIPTLADALYISQRQLERLYQIHVGMTPKQFARLLRVEAARTTLKQLRNVSLAQVSAALDYYDQAHFTHEFKAIVGLTPGNYLQTHPGYDTTSGSSSAMITGSKTAGPGAV